MNVPGIDILESAAAAYEELLVPALFADWAERVAGAARIRPGQRVLDVACGTGVLARAAAKRVGASGSVSGLDLNPGMLAVAARLAPQIDWRQGSAEALPFPGGSFDAVVSQFGLMFFPDPAAALREMARVLAPGGRLAVAVFDALERISAYQTMTEVLRRTIGEHAAQALQAPFTLGGREEISALLATTGLDAAAIVTEHGAARFPSVRAMVLADVKGWFPVVQIILDDGQVETLVREAEAALQTFQRSGAGVEFPVSAHIITAVV